MITKIFNFGEIDVNNIIIQKPIKYGNHIIKFPIKYKYKSRKYNLLIQSPKMYLPFQLMNFNNYYIIDYSFCNIDFDAKQNLFLILLNEINIKIRKLIKSGDLSIYFKHNKMVSSLKSKFMYPNILRTKIYNKNPNYFEIYNQNKELISFDEIRNSLYCKSILFLSDIWISLKNKSYGLTWNTLQMKIELPLYLKGYRFLEDHCDDNNDSIENHTVYKKYFKMIKMGIPLNAVKHKMKMNGDDPNIIEMKPNSKLPNSLSKKIKNKKFIPTNNLFKSFKFKKGIQKSIKNIKSFKKIKDSRTPSLEEIINSKSSLHKTGLFKNLI